MYFNTNKKSKLIKIIIGISILALTAIIIIVSVASCADKNKITLDEGRDSNYSWSNKVSFYTTAHRQSNDGSQNFYVILSIYNAQSNKIYIAQQTYSFEKYSYIEPVFFEIEKWLIDDYQTFDFSLSKKWEYNLDKPQDRHVFKETITISPTCLNSGTKKTTCSHCSISKSESLPALGHNWQNTNCLNCGLKMRTYKLTISESLISNNHVGNSWSQTYKYNDKVCGRSLTVTAPPDSTISILATVTEHDEVPDVGTSNIKVILTDGKTSSGTVTVQENRGKYARNKAKWSIMISVEELK